MEPQSLFASQDTSLDSMSSPQPFICPTAMTNAPSPDEMSDTVSVKSESTCNDSLDTSSSQDASPPKKKRKSWGQVLPTPTTNLPPRKRAKTDEEKAQRRYERVQRNRHAAHQSRMRKQEEMEKLQLENTSLKQHNSELHDRVQQLEAVLATVNKHSHFTQAPLTPPASFDPPTPELSSPNSIPSDDIDIETPPYSPITQSEMNPLNGKVESNDSQSAVDVGFAALSSGQAEINLDFGLDEYLQPLEMTTDFKFDEFLNLDGLQDSTNHFDNSQTFASSNDTAIAKSSNWPSLEQTAPTSSN